MEHILYGGSVSTMLVGTYCMIPGTVIPQNVFPIINVDVRWTCDYCCTSNPLSAGRCEHCGAPPPKLESKPITDSETREEYAPDEDSEELIVEKRSLKFWKRKSKK